MQRKAAPCAAAKPASYLPTPLVLTQLALWQPQPHHPDLAPLQQRTGHRLQLIRTAVAQVGVRVEGPLSLELLQRGRKGCIEHKW